MVFKRSISLSIGLFILICGDLPAQDSDSTQSSIQTVDIEATHAAIHMPTASLSISVIDRSDTEVNGQPAVSLQQITDHTPGIWVWDRGNYALGEHLMIRGFGWRSATEERGSMVVLDGIPLTTPSGKANMNVIPPSLVRSAEIVRGPASTFWGNSSSGVLYLSTQPSDQHTSSFRLRTMLGSYGLRNYQVQVSQPIGDHFASGYYSFQSTDGYRNYSAAKLHRAGLTSSFELASNLTLHVNGAYLSIPFAENPGSLSRSEAQTDPTKARLSYETDQVGLSDRQGQLGASVDWDSKIGDLRLSGHQIFRDWENPLPQSYVEVSRSTGGGRFTYQNNDWLIQWMLGAEYSYQYDDRLVRDNAQGEPGLNRQSQQLEEVQNKAAFGYLTIPWKMFYISGGGRYDEHTFRLEDDYTADGDASGSHSFESISYSAGAGIQFKQQHVYANLSTGFQAPTVHQFRYHPELMEGFNTGLDPKNTQSMEAGLRGSIASIGLHYDVGYFDMTIDNYLVAYQQEGSNRILYKNQGETSHKGIEASLQLAPNRYIEVGATYTQNQATFAEGPNDDSTRTVAGNTVPGIPGEIITGYMTLSWNDLNLTPSVRSVGSFYLNNANTDQNNAYTLLDVRINHSGIPLGQTSRLVPFLQINNVTDINYYGSVLINNEDEEYFEPAAGRNGQAGFVLEFK